MKAGIAIYVEGGGDQPAGKAQLRQGLDALLGVQKDAARKRGLGWKLVPCGCRGAAFDAFRNAVTRDSTRISILLVDAEDTVTDTTAPGRVQHLRSREGWDLSGVKPDHVHLMIQCMEAWIVADADAICEYYGHKFLRNALPQRQDLEEESKQDVLAALQHGTRKTQKGEYDKIRDASALLQRITPARVSARCPNFALFTRWLEGVIAEATDL